MTTAPNVTDAMRQAARGKIRHTPECRPTAADLVKTRGGKGDLLLRCKSCRQFVVLAPAATRNTPRPTPEHTPKPAPAPVAVVVAEPAPEPAPELDPNQASGYVCRDHHNPVNWRGHGCPECRADTRRQHRRRAARAADRRTKTSSTQPERNIS